MTLKELIKTTATFLGREDVVEYLNQTQTDTSEHTLHAVEVLTRLANLVINELACSFIPMLATQTLSVTEGKVYHTVLDYNPLEILSAKDANDKDVLVKVQALYTQVSSDSVTMEYSYFPPEYQLEDSVGYKNTQVTVSELAYGVCAEYCITINRFEEAVMWHTRYEKSITERVTATQDKTEQEPEQEPEQETSPTQPTGTPKNVMIKGRYWI